MVKINKFSFSKLLQNNKILFVFAIIVSTILWIYMNINSTNDTTITINNIPIQIELSEEATKNGLKVFSNNNETASVTISGNRAVLGSVTEKDITVTAAANEITTPHKYTLSVYATKTNPSSNFQIVQVNSTRTINVLVDIPFETTFPITDDIHYTPKEGYYDASSLSAKEIKISGPQTKISEINYVTASAELKDDKLSETTSVKANIVLHDKNKKELSTEYFDLEFNTIDATITVLPKKTVDVLPKFTNQPSDFDYSNSYQISPSKIVIAGPKNILDVTKTVSIMQPINFNQLSNKTNTFTDRGIELPEGCINLSNYSSAKVTLDFNKLKSKKVVVKSFKVEGLEKGYKSKILQNSVSVTVIGTENELKKVTSDKIKGVIDASDIKNSTGSFQLTSDFKIKDNDYCWVYGTYNINIEITKE